MIQVGALPDTQQDNFKEPVVTIGGVPIIVQRFSWSRTAGSRPFITHFIVPKAGNLHEKLLKVKNPTTIEQELWGGTGPKATRHTVKFEQIYLLQPKEIDDFTVLWQVADTRFNWRGLKFYFSYNKTRAANKIGISINPAEDDPAALARAFRTFPKGRFLPWSVKPNGDPYTVKEILDIELPKLGIKTKKLQKDNSYIVENVEFEGVSVYDGLDDLMGRSRMNLGLSRKGEAYIYSVDFYDEKTKAALNQITDLQQQQKTGPGIIYFCDKSRIRPKKINIRFEKKLEVRVVGKHTPYSPENPQGGNKPLSIQPNPPLITQQDIANRRVIGAENVLPIPWRPDNNHPWRQQFVQVFGRIPEIGEYVPMQQFLAAINLPDLTLRETYLVSGITQFSIAISLTLSGGGAWIEGNMILAAHLAGAIKTHYRQTYQLDPYFLNRMEFFDCRRVGVIDNYSGFTPPSPAFMDSCIVPPIKTAVVAKRKALWGRHVYNWIVNTEDPFRENSTPGKVVVVAPQLGIIRVVFNRDLTHSVKQIIPSAVDNLPKLEQIDVTRKAWSQARLSAEHTFETIISVVWDVDKKDDFNGTWKYFSIDFPQNATGPPINYLSRLDYARYPVWSPTDAGQIDPNVAVNKGIVEAIGIAEHAKIINQYKDRYLGSVILAGDIDIGVDGNMLHVTTHFGSGGLETEIDMKEPPPDPTIPQVLPQKVINYLYRNVSNAQNVNNVNPGGGP